MRYKLLHVFDDAVVGLLSCNAAFSLIAVLPADVASFGLVDCESKLNPMFHKMPTAEVKGTRYLFCAE